MMTLFLWVSIDPTWWEVGHWWTSSVLVDWNAIAIPFQTIKYFHSVTHSRLIDLCVNKEREI